MYVDSNFRSFAVYIVVPLGYSAKSLDVQHFKVNEINSQCVVKRFLNVTTRLVYEGNYTIVGIVLS